MRVEVLSALLAQILQTIDSPNLNKILLVIKKLISFSFQQTHLILLFDFRHLSPLPISLVSSAVHYAVALVTSLHNIA